MQNRFAVASGCEFNGEVHSEPFLPSLAPASACYRKAVLHSADREVLFVAMTNEKCQMSYGKCSAPEINPESLLHRSFRPRLLGTIHPPNAFQTF